MRVISVQILFVGSNLQFWTNSTTFVDSNADGNNDKYVTAPLLSAIHTLTHTS